MDFTAKTLSEAPDDDTFCLSSPMRTCATVLYFEAHVLPLKHLAVVKIGYAFRALFHFCSPWFAPIVILPPSAKLDPVSASSGFQPLSLILFWLNLTDTIVQHFLLRTMKMKIGGYHGFALVFSLIFIAGCASPSRVALPTQYRGQMGTVASVARLGQEEIAAQINEANSQAIGGQFGLIGSLTSSIIDASINKSRAKQAEQDIASVRNALLDYDVSKAVEKALGDGLSNSILGEKIQVQVRLNKAQPDYELWVKESPSDTLLLVRLNYSLTPGFLATRVTADVSLHSKITKIPNVAKDGIPAASYYNSFVVQMPSGGAQLSKATENAEIITGAGGKLVEESLDRAFSELSALIAYDLGKEARLDNTLYKAPEGARKYAVTLSGNAQITVAGYVEEARDGRVWVRLPSGELHSVID